jgi:major membrane immunogen (membrane-anchored lipoprotein)
MAEVAFQYQIPQKMIGTFVVDAFIAEGYKFSNSVTDIPVEEGSNIADHIIEDQDVVTVQALIGNTAFEVVTIDGNSISNLEAPDRMARVRQAYFELKNMVKEKRTFDVVLGLETFTSMVITSFNIDRDAANGANLPFTMEFKKIKIVKSDTTEINAANRNGSGGQTDGTLNAGTAGTQQPTDSEAKEQWRFHVRKRGESIEAKADYQRKWGVPYPQ